MKELIQAAQDLRVAAEALIEMASRPDDQSRVREIVLAAFANGEIEVLDEEAVRRVVREVFEGEELRDLVHRWQSQQFSDKLENLEEKMETMVDSAVEEKASDMGNWDNLDPSTVEEACDTIDKYPDHDDVERLTENIDIEDYHRAVATAHRLDELVERAEPLLQVLDSLRPKLKAAV